MPKPHQKRPKRRASRSVAQDRQRPQSRVQRKPAAIAPPVEHGRLMVSGHDLGPAEFNPRTGVIEIGPHVAKRYATRGLADKIVGNARIARPWVACIVTLAPEGCEVKILGTGAVTDVIVGPGIRSTFKLAGEALAARYEKDLRLNAELIGQEALIKALEIARR